MRARDRVVLAAAVLALACGCAGTSLPETEIDSCLSDTIKRDAKVTLTDCVPGEWDVVVVAAPYSNVRSVLAPYKAKPPRELLNCGIDVRDHFCVLIFVRGDRVVAWSRVNRGVMDFTDASKTLAGKRETAFGIKADATDRNPVAVVISQ